MKPASGPIRLLLLALGWLSAALAALGAFLPVLPTTPFLIVAAACFFRSSPRFYRWLLESPLFGPILRNWRDTGTIPARTKVFAIVTIVIVGGSTVAFVLTKPWLRVLVAATLFVGIVSVLRIPTSRAMATDEGSP